MGKQAHVADLSVHYSIQDSVLITKSLYIKPVVVLRVSANSRIGDAKDRILAREMRAQRFSQSGIAQSRQR